MCTRTPMFIYFFRSRQKINVFVWFLMRRSPHLSKHMKLEKMLHFRIDFGASPSTLTDWYQTCERDSSKIFFLRSANTPNKILKCIKIFITTPSNKKSTSKTPPISLFRNSHKPSQKTEWHQTHEPHPENAHIPKYRPRPPPTPLEYKIDMTTFLYTSTTTSHRLNTLDNQIESYF